MSQKICNKCNSAIKIDKVVVIGNEMEISSCQCPPESWEEERQKGEVSKIIRNCRLTKRMLAETMDDYQQTTGNSSAYEWWRNCHTNIEQFVSGRRSALVWGPVGSGKTKIATDIFKRVILTGLPGYYYSSAEIKLKLSDCIFDKGDLRVFTEKLKGVAVLFLDDIGQVKLQDRFDSFWYAVINHRYDEEKITIATTHLNSTDLGASIGYEVASRLYAMCRGGIVGIKDERDYRLVK